MQYLVFYGTCRANRNARRLSMMNTLRLTAVLGATALGFGQDAVVEKSAVWLDTVKRGDMTVSVRGRGVLGANRIIEMSVAETQVREIRVGQRAQFDTRNGLVQGKVSR